ncbi:MAG: NAD(P)H-dependent oxidoreductase [Psychroflexus sp.]|nr:NAD(P)H-dependent oxidoreductase [Psychroflexus sp.]
MNKHIEDLKWRYAAKKHDPSKPVSDDNLAFIKKSVQLSASSFGLQPYEIFIIKDMELRKKLQEVSFGQPQIVDAQYLMVFCYNTIIDEAYLDELIKNTSETRGVSIESLEGMRQAIKGSVLQFNQKQKEQWAWRQAYIALGFLLNAAPKVKVDVSPMEGFQNDKYDDILGLKEKNLKTGVIAAIGHRSEDDELKDALKVRKPENELFHEL